MYYESQTNLIFLDPEIIRMIILELPYVEALGNLLLTCKYFGMCIKSPEDFIETLKKKFATEVTVQKYVGAQIYVLIKYSALANNYKHGMYRQYDPNNALSLEVEYKDNMKQGLWRQYFGKNGAVWWEGYYKNNYRVGIWREYSFKGNLRQEGNYNDGKKEGRWLEYEPKDNAYRELFYKNNQLKKWSKWKSSSNISI
jgi:antitoxin component YwqK of YwqJK toxin-antitoxin module